MSYCVFISTISSGFQVSTIQAMKSLPNHCHDDVLSHHAATVPGYAHLPLCDRRCYPPLLPVGAGFGKTGKMARGLVWVKGPLCLSLLLVFKIMSRIVTLVGPCWSQILGLQCARTKKKHAAAMNGFLSPPTESTLAVFVGDSGGRNTQVEETAPMSQGCSLHCSNPSLTTRGQGWSKGSWAQVMGNESATCEHCSTCSTLDGQQQDLNDVHLTPVSSPKAFTIRSTHHQSTTGSTTAQASAPHPPSRAPAPTGVPPGWSSAKRGSRWPVTPVPCALLGSSSALQRASDHTWNGLGSVRCWWVLIKIQNYCWKFISCCISRLSVAVFPENIRYVARKSMASFWNFDVWHWLAICKKSQHFSNCHHILTGTLAASRKESRQNSNSPPARRIYPLRPALLRHALTVGDAKKIRNTERWKTGLWCNIVRGTNLTQELGISRCTSA